MVFLIFPFRLRTPNFQWPIIDSRNLSKNIFTQMKVCISITTKFLITILKELQIIFYAFFVCGHYFFNTGLSKSAFPTFYFGKLVFCLSVFSVFRKFWIQYSASLAKWLSDHLQTKWLWFRILLLSLKFQISSMFRARSSLTFRQLKSVDSLWNASVTW